MTKQFVCLPILALSISLLASAQATPAKVGIIHIQNAIISTADGQKAATALQNKFDPKRKTLESKQNEIETLRAELSRGSNTMSEDRRAQLARDIDQKTRALNRDTEDAQADFDLERNKIMQDLGQKMMALIDKYARDNNFTLLLDVSSPESPVLFAANGIDITQDIVKLYDQSAAPPPAPPAAPKPAAPAKK